jgi:hypothetical protein
MTLYHYLNINILHFEKKSIIIIQKVILDQ